MSPSFRRLASRLNVIKRGHIHVYVLYVAATLFTARAQHFRFVDLPEWLRFLYPLVRVGHDYVALPLWRLAHARTPRAR